MSTYPPRAAAGSNPWPTLHERTNAVSPGFCKITAVVAAATANRSMAPASAILLRSRLEVPSDPTEEDAVKGEDRDERPTQIRESAHIRDEDPRIRRREGVVLEREDHHRGDDHDERHQEGAPGDDRVVVARLTSAEVAQTDPEIWPRRDMDDHGNPAEEQVDVDRAGLGEEDDPSAECEGGPEERGAHAEEQGSAPQLARPERTTTGRARKEKGARHDPTASAPALHKLLSGVRDSH